jgi:hypothetical protein
VHVFVENCGEAGRILVIRGIVRLEYDPGSFAVVLVPDSRANASFFGLWYVYALIWKI